MFSFIILNYNNIDETINCLNKLQSIKNKDCNFIVVDNATLNKKNISKIEEYTNDILLLKENFGFAKANNKGIKYAKEKYNSDFYIVINNDVEITQKNFLEIIKKNYKKYKFDMMGPWIDSPGDSVNPFPAFTTKKEVENEIEKSKRISRICDSRIKYWLLILGIKMKHLIKKPIKNKNGVDIELNVPLHGCAIIFSKKYVNKYEYPFINDTFLFHEESLLYNRVKKDKLTTLYNPDLKIYHKEGSTMCKINKNSRLRRKFREEEKIKSLEILLKEM